MIQLLKELIWFLILFYGFVAGLLVLSLLAIGVDHYLQWRKQNRKREVES